METWAKGVGLRPCGKPPDAPPNPKAVAHHSSIPTLIIYAEAGRGLLRGSDGITLATGGRAAHLVRTVLHGAAGVPRRGRLGEGKAVAGGVRKEHCQTP